MKIRNMSIYAAIAIVQIGLIGCDDHGHDHPTTESSAAREHAHGPSGEHTPATVTSADHVGPMIALGTATSGPFALVATREQGELIAGNDAGIDVTVTATTAKVVALRVWIGTEHGKGSVKAKASIENPAEPNRWHAHAEIPEPLPADARLWVEVETDAAAKSIASFALKE